MKPKNAGQDTSPLIAGYLAELRQSVASNQALVAQGERERPALQAAYDEAARVLDDHVESHRFGSITMGDMARADDGREALWQKRQEAADALRRSDDAVKKAREDMAAAEYLVGADDNLKRAESAYAACVAFAQAAQERFVSANETCNGIEVEKAERAQRRTAVIESNKAALRAHTERAMAARAEGKPVPDAPAQKAVAAADQSDADLDMQLAAAVGVREEYRAAVAAIVSPAAEGEDSKIEQLRGELLAARFREVDARARIALQMVAGPLLLEHDAARSAYHTRARGLQPSLELPKHPRDHVDARTAELRASIPPLWNPSVDVERSSAVIVELHADPSNAEDQAAA